MHLSPPAGMCAHQRCTNCAPIGAQPPLAAPICAPHKHRPLAPPNSWGSFLGWKFLAALGNFEILWIRGVELSAVEGRAIEETGVGAKKGNRSEKVVLNLLKCSGLAR